MGIRFLHSVVSGLRSGAAGIRHLFPDIKDVPRGHFAVYIGESQRRFVIPLSYLENPSFQSLLDQVGEEIGFRHAMGGLTIPFAEEHDFASTLAAHFNEECHG